MNGIVTEEIRLEREIISGKVVPSTVAAAAGYWPSVCAVFSPQHSICGSVLRKGERYFELSRLGHKC